MWDVMLAALAVGLMAGVLTGMFGIGGGVVMVPVLDWLYRSHGLSDQVALTTAVATSLLSITVTGFNTSWQHHRNRRLRTEILLPTLMGTLLGSGIGVMLMHQLTAARTRLSFGLFLWTLAVLMLFQRTPRADNARIQGHLNLLLLAITGMAMGTLAAWFGVGGSALVVPALVVVFGVSIHQAIATSTLLMSFAALTGVVQYIWTGLDHSSGMAWSWGWVHLPSALCLMAGAWVSAKPSARLAGLIPAALLRRAMVVLLLLIGSKLVLAP